MVGRKIDSLRSLHEVQGKMIKLMNNTVTAVSKPGRYKEYENIEKMEVQMLSAAGSAMKDGKWPEHLDPMPMVRNTLAWLYLNKREFFAATRHALSGTLMSRYRSGPEWVNNLCTLTQCLAAIAACSRDEPFFNTGDFISLKETQRAVGGYGMVLCGDAGLVFGGKSKYTEFLCDWFAWVVKGAEVPKPGSREFEPLFWEAQKKLLAWADIDTSFAIVLPGSSDALSMEEACTRAMEEMEVAGSPVKAKDAGGVTGK
jgi:SET and MYND domain-containing protein